MLSDFIDLKVINQEKLKELIDTLKCLGFDCEIFISESKKYVFRYGEDLSIHNDINSLFNWLKVALVDIQKSISNEEKKQRQLRHMLIDQCELVAQHFGKVVYTLSLGRKED